ncbi:hypothetical protein VIGAN_02343600, partial [Vigna angularis var. angularis]
HYPFNGSCSTNPNTIRASLQIHEIEMVSGISNKSSQLERMKKLLRRDGWRYRGRRERKKEEKNVYASKLRFLIYFNEG